MARQIGLVALVYWYKRASVNMHQEEPCGNSSLAFKGVLCTLACASVHQIQPCVKRKAYMWSWGLLLDVWQMMFV